MKSERRAGEPFASAATVRQRIEEANALATSAIIEYRTGSGSRAAELHLRTKRAWIEIINGIAELPENEADQVEPMFTRLEEQLFTLGALQ
jgi:hypothetical protein